MGGNEHPASGLAEDTVVVILAAGKGTRMGRSDLCKVCFEIDSAPAINRVITAFKRNRFQRFLLVVGSKADQVMNTVAAAHPGVMYIYQEPQLGTGHAARLAAEALENLGFQGHVLVTAGDKLIEDEAIRTLVEGFVKQQADMALLTVPVTKATERSVGRVFVDSAGQALDIIERADRVRASIGEELSGRLAEGNGITGEDILRVADRHFPDRAKQSRAIGELVALVPKDNPCLPVDTGRLAEVLQSSRYRLQIDGRPCSERQIARICRGANTSFYLFRAETFYRGLNMISNDNAQGEYYLTDIVRLLAGIITPQGERQYRIRAVPGANPDWIQGFNSPDELLAIQDYARRRKQESRQGAIAASRPQLRSNQYATVAEWLRRLEERPAGLRRWLRRIYGEHEDLRAEKLRDLVLVLNCYAKRFGRDERVCIVRAPARVNLMGRHVDHRGGYTNFLAIDRETLAVAGLREDSHVVAVNTQSRQFPPVGFSIPELIGRFAWSDWLNFVNSDWVRNMLRQAAGDWGNYIKASMLRLQHRYQDVQVRGINMALSGSVPMAAGLSSSSTLVVATLQAAIALNNFELTSQQFIDLCGEGEWFVGSRGGAGDHAAIYLGQRGKIAHVGYLPFRVEKIIDAPRDSQVVIANSHIMAKKSGSARDTFNEKVASYNLGLALLRQRCAEIAPTVECLRDVDPARIGCATSDIYRMLLKIPERMTRQDFRRMLSKEHAGLLDVNFATHAEPACYHPRGVLLYGIAEIMRSKLCVEQLESGRIEELGRMMKISHEGDRVSVPGANGQYGPFSMDCSDACLHRLISDLASEDPQKVLRSQLYMQAGSYGCSTPEIDQMVDIACEVPGVHGAQLAGAGLGGCIMILARKENVDSVRRRLTERYYRPAGLKPAILPCIAVEGAGLVEF